MRCADEKNNSSRVLRSNWNLLGAADTAEFRAELGGHGPELISTPGTTGLPDAGVVKLRLRGREGQELVRSIRWKVPGPCLTPLPTSPRR